MKHFFVKTTGILLLLFGVGCQSTTSVEPPKQPAPKPLASETLVLGDISEQPTTKIEEFQPLANYLATHLTQAGIKLGTVKVAPDMPTMAKWLATGEVDLYFDSPYPAMIVGDQSKAQPILRRWKNGISEYHTVIFVRQASGLKQLSDLQGHKIAFEDNFSTSGYMLPLAYLIRTNLKVLKEGDLPSEDGAKDKVLYRFSGNDENSIQWVLRGRVDAAAVGSYKFAEIPAAVRNQLKILTKTEVLPRHLVLASPTLDERTQGAIKTVLMAMDETEEGRAILQQFEQTAQFDGFPEGAEAALARMRDLYDLVKNK